MDIIQELSTKLLKFKPSGNSYTFRCPYCGDSQINKYKTRCYIFKSKLGNYVIKCHNCQITKSLNNFLKDNFPDLFNTFIYSKYKGNNNSLKISENICKMYKPIIFKSYPTVKELHKEHLAKLYLSSRKLPLSFQKEVFYIDEFKSFTNKYKHTYNNLSYEESRIVVPLIIHGDVVGYQGRLFGSDGIRYLTIMLGNYPKIYNFDNIDWKLPVYITEGIYDSLFIPNCIAMLGSDMDNDFLKQYSNTEFRFIYDNEPYSKQILSRMNKVIDLGHSICIWHKNIEQKDVNDYVLSGGNVKDITENYYSGIRAKLEIKQFAKV